MYIWRLRTTTVIVAGAAWLTACAPVPVASPPEVELGPEPVAAAEVPELLSLPKPSPRSPQDHAIAAGGNPSDPPMLLKVARTTVQPQERPQIVYSSRPSREESRRWMRRETLESPRVRNAIGKRYALLNSGWVDDEKDDSSASVDRYQMVFYNYMRNEVVTVVTTGGREPVSLESTAPDTQPPESREEVDAAIDIVRRDARYGQQVANLHGRGILTPAPGRDRHLYLLFYDAPRSTPARFQATVNMSTGKVLEAKSLR